MSEGARAIARGLARGERARQRGSFDRVSQHDTTAHPRTLDECNCWKLPPIHDTHVPVDLLCNVVFEKILLQYW